MEDKNYIKNKEINNYEIEQKKTILESKPLRLGITITDKCNLSCWMCPSSIRRGRYVLSKLAVEKIKEIAPYLETIYWQGGEIFYAEYLKDIFRETTDYPQIEHEIITSGLLLDEEWLDIFFNLNHISLSFSIDSVVKETYEYIRTGAKFEKLLQQLNLLKEAEQKYGKEIKKSITVVVMKCNYKQLELFIDFAQKYGFKEISFYPILVNKQHGEDLFDKQSEENIFSNMQLEIKYELASIIRRIKQLSSALDLNIYCNLPGIEISSSEAACLSKNSQLFCSLPWKNMWIDTNRKEKGEGSIFPECMCQEEIGNINTDSLLEAWNSSKMQEYRRRIANNDLSLCSYVCRSGMVAKERLTHV